MSDDTTNLYAHAPLPYVVTVRVMISEDAPPQRIEHKVVAYSLYEAIFTAVIQSTGAASLNDARCVIESVAPDTMEWTRMKLMQVMSKASEKK